MRALPALDLHAHVDPRIPAGDLIELGSVVFAVTRSLEEAEAALQRDDKWTAWGVGCHPNLQGAHNTYQADRFRALIADTAFVSEVGLDGRSEVSMKTQRDTLCSVLSELQAHPRLTSIHSFQAANEVLSALDEHPIDGAILHWWLGDADQTQRALGLGCYFSINASSVRRAELLAEIPLDRVLTETDHPFGDRMNETSRPGAVTDVEEQLAGFHGISPTELRFVVWDNLGRLVRNAGCAALLPRAIRTHVAAL